MEPTTNRTDGFLFVAFLFLVACFAFSMMWLLTEQPVGQWAMDVVEFVIFFGEEPTTEEEWKAYQELLNNPLQAMVSNTAYLVLVMFTAWGGLFFFIFLLLYARLRGNHVDEKEEFNRPKKSADEVDRNVDEKEWGEWGGNVERWSLVDNDNEE